MNSDKEINNNSNNSNNINSNTNNNNTTTNNCVVYLHCFNGSRLESIRFAEKFI